MADRQWFAEGVQIFEDGEEEVFAEGVQWNEDQPAAAGEVFPTEIFVGSERLRRHLRKFK